MEFFEFKTLARIVTNQIEMSPNDVEAIVEKFAKNVAAYTLRAASDIAREYGSTQDLTQIFKDLEAEVRNEGKYDA